MHTFYLYFAQAYTELPMATNNTLGNLFGRSPIRPIQEHMQIAEEAAQLLPQLIQATIDDDWERASEIHKAIVSAAPGSMTPARE